jgi:hypothetical protein
MDRDLCDFRENPYLHEISGEDVVSWMITHGIFPKHIFIHSMNFQGARRMDDALQRAGIESFIWPYGEELVRFLSDPSNTQ